MRWIEIRRHAEKRHDGELAQAGVDSARALGQGMGPYRRVVTSPVPRAVHTAVAMGFAVDEQVPGLSQLPAAAEAELHGLGRPFQDVWLALQRSPAVARVAEDQAALYRHLAQSLRRDAWMLVVGHSGLIELACLALVEHDELARIRLGAGLGYCEGVRLGFDGERVGELQVVRV